MFHAHGTTIFITRGDTGVLTLIAEGHAFAAGDRAVFTVRRPGGVTLMETVMTPEEDGRIQIGFDHGMTERWRPGCYAWDVRYVLDAAVDEQGRVTGGREVITPMRPGELHVLEAVGKI